MGMGAFCARFESETIGNQRHAGRKLRRLRKTWPKNVLIKEFSIYG
ncbi:hypothetical protein O206_04710 [Ochrobactrum sp. EGD-AQ16]|jgi:hypothetical protein|nr:hypothetical protein O206_04710 [Ochrobactrum sp. EGD-AQ16]